MTEEQQQQQREERPRKRARSNDGDSDNDDSGDDGLHLFKKSLKGSTIKNENRPRREGILRGLCQKAADKGKCYVIIEGMTSNDINYIMTLDLNVIYSLTSKNMIVYWPREHTYHPIWLVYFIDICVEKEIGDFMLNCVNEDIIFITDDLHELTMLYEDKIKTSSFEWEKDSHTRKPLNNCFRFGEDNVKKPPISDIEKCDKKKPLDPSFSF